jgi:hypothetical protein
MVFETQLTDFHTMYPWSLATIFSAFAYAVTVDLYQEDRHLDPKE